MLAANYAAPNSVVAPSLGRNLSGNAANVTVNLVAPGTMYGDRINQLDVRVAKTLRYGRSRTMVARRRLQRAELERGADLQQRVRSGRAVAAAADDPDAAVRQDHRRDRLLTSHAHRAHASSVRAMAVAARGGLHGASVRSTPRGRRIGRSRCSCCTRRDGTRRSPSSVSASCRESSTRPAGRARLLLRVHRPGEVPRPGVPSGLPRFPAAEIPGSSGSTSSSRCSDVALEFVDRNRSELFPDTPVVFFANRPPLAAPRTRPA